MIQAVFLHQLFVGAALRHNAAIQDDDLIGIFHSPHPVGDNEDGFALYQMGDCLLNFRLVVHVQGGSGLVQQNHRRVFQKCPGNGQTLALAAGKGGAILTDDGLVALRQLLDKVVAVGSFGGSDDVRIRGILAAYTNILHHGVVKQHHILKYHGEILHQGSRVDGGNIRTAQGDLAVIRIVKTCRKIGDCALSAAGGP